MKFILTINTDNAAFGDGDCHERDTEIARILRHVAIQLERDFGGRQIYDLFHKSRVLSSRHTDKGLLFAIVTSDALDMNNSRRGCRFVIFDIFGTVLERTKLEGAFRTSAQATKAMWNAVNAIDAKAVTLAAIDRQAKQYADEMAALQATVSKLEI